LIAPDDEIIIPVRSPIIEQDAEVAPPSPFTFYQGFRANHPRLNLSRGELKIESKITTRTITTETIQETKFLTTSIFPSLSKFIPLGSKRTKGSIGFSRDFGISLSRPVPATRSLIGLPVDVIQREKATMSNVQANSNSIIAITNIFSTLIGERDAAFSVCEDISAERVCSYLTILL
jgi:hypothetical protein